ncbi:MAG: squalene--hopene cyclase, partial [Microcystaceae cyanobacterium]
TASQTAWALIGLLDAQQVGVTVPTLSSAIEQGVNYLISTQTSSGYWEEQEFTGTGFPCHFYIRYHYYRQYFPLMALGRYQKALEEVKE